MGSRSIKVRTFFMAISYFLIFSGHSVDFFRKNDIHILIMEK
jgi:hypothetical protein